MLLAFYNLFAGRNVTVGLTGVSAVTSIGTTQLVALNIPTTITVVSSTFTPTTFVVTKSDALGSNSVTTGPPGFVTGAISLALSGNSSVSSITTFTKQEGEPLTGVSATTSAGNIPFHTISTTSTGTSVSTSLGIIRESTVDPLQTFLITATGYVSNLTPVITEEVSSVLSGITAGAVNALPSIVSLTSTGAVSDVGVEIEQDCLAVQSTAYCGTLAVTIESTLSEVIVSSSVVGIYWDQAWSITGVSAVCTPGRYRSWILNTQTLGAAGQFTVSTSGSKLHEKIKVAPMGQAIKLVPRTTSARLGSGTVIKLTNQ